MIIVPLYAIAADYSMVQVGLLLSIAAAGAVVTTIGVGFLSDWFGRKPPLLAISPLTTLGATIFSFTTEFWIPAIMAATFVPKTLYEKMYYQNEVQLKKLRVDRSLLRHIEWTYKILA